MFLLFAQVVAVEFGYTRIMQFAILFILAFLAGLAIYRFLSNWVPAVILPMALFTITTLLDFGAREAWMFTLLFGLPIVFMGSLLGAYVVQIRRPELEEIEQDSSER